MNKETRIDFKVFKRLLQFVKLYKQLLFYSFICTIILAILAPLRPKLIGLMVNKYIVGGQNETALLHWTLVILGILFLEGVFQFLGTYSSNLLAQSIIRDIRQKLFKHIISFKMKYFDQTPIGSLVTRLISDIEAIAEVFSSGLIDILGDFLMLVVVIFIMFLTNWHLAILTLIPIPLLIVATKIFAKAMKRSFQQERLQVTRLSTFVQEHLSGMSIVQLFTREKQEEKLFQEINRDHRRAHVKAVWAFSIFFPVVEILSSLSIAFLLVWGAFQFLGEKPSNPKIMYAEIISFTLWIQMLFRPIRQLADKFNILQRGVVRAERVFEVLDLDEHMQQQGLLSALDFEKDIHFNNVSFAYKEEDWVLKNFSLTIKNGENVAFVGATGAGKSTIVNLLGRFYEFQKGDIFIGDINIKSIQLAYLRRKIAIVLQDVFLFSDSILNNITLRDPSISREEVIAASKIVGADSFISKLPGGYDYNVGERGGVLSVGQRQILSFVRAYVYNPTILILDEATSSVDNESEEMIKNATKKLTEGRTSLIIAHRLSTIQQANKIVVIDKGEIVEEGTHEFLIQQKGYYNKLHDIQFVNQTKNKL
jgi:ATP-binding cassette subfamily B multidrug efflux pump